MMDHDPFWKSVDGTYMCMTCKHNTSEWDEDPCDSCTGDNYVPAEGIDTDIGGKNDGNR